MSRIIKWIVGLGIVAICGVAGAWATQTYMVPTEETGQSGEAEATRVGVTTPDKAEIEDSLSVVGSILALRSIELRPLSSGRVAEVPVSSGEEVAEGDLIVRLDARAAQAALADAQATFDEAQAEYGRYRTLEDENVAAEARLEQARGGFDRARAALDAARADVDDRSLRAPFAGILGLVDLDQGEYVDSTSSVTTLDDLSSVQAEFSLPERYFDRAKVGQTVRLEATAYPDREFVGEVSVKAPAIIPESRSFKVRVLIPNEDRALASGMFVRAELVFGVYQSLTVPDDAIISEGNATYAYVVADGTARRTDVDIGSSAGGRTEIVSDLAEDARVVVTGWDTLNDGAPVEIAEGDLSAEALN